MHTTSVMHTGAADQPPRLVTYTNSQFWFGPEMGRRSDWIHEFKPSEIAEIDAAVQSTERSGLEILNVKRADFVLPTVGPLLARARQESLHGKGFHLFRGIPVDRYSMRQAAIAFWGIGLHFGEPVSQNGKGHVLGHVANLGLNYTDPETRGYQTNARLPYHTDSSDIVALLCLRTAKAGGLSSMVSSTTIWNELLRRRPDLAETLMDPLYYTRWGEIPAGKKAFEPVPLFVPHNGRMLATYVRSAIMKAQAIPGVPPLTPKQVEALDFVDTLAADPELHLDMEFRPGDIQLAGNHSVFHSRTSYEDWPEQHQRRHLLRLWVACEDGPDLPLVIRQRNGETASGRPAGIRVPGVPLVAPLEAV
ncbi:TauD/TfdA family dioxygenase [Pseudorhodoferax sp. LjRoot39]|uniref:TauD/TfdA family dioxygenase n=1 Tax=Pseudorhodoferax sp. LjRoot39 TaxID=3342328 RepID=UPI003ED05184